VKAPGNQAFMLFCCLLRHSSQKHRGILQEGEMIHLGSLSKDSDSNLQEIKKTREIVMAGVADVSSYVDKLNLREEASCMWL
jgi:hypothetical protein